MLFLLQKDQKLQESNVREKKDVKRENEFDRNVEECYLWDEVKEKDHKEMKECQKDCENIGWKEDVNEQGEKKVIMKKMCRRFSSVFKEETETSQCGA